MGAELRYGIAQIAYVKLVLHALKQRTSAVNAVLLGRLSSATDNDVVEISDAIPLFHSRIGLPPYLEIAQLQREEYYGAQGMSVVGYFPVNERFDDGELHNVTKNIGDHIYRYFPQAAVFLLDNKKLEALPERKDQTPMM